MTETVNVTEEVPLVETRTSDLSHLIEAKSIEDLPLGNRRTLNVINLTGAAVFVSYARCSSTSECSANCPGAR